MIFVADENIEFYIVSALRKIGYVVEYIAERQPVLLILIFCKMHI